MHKPRSSQVCNRAWSKLQTLRLDAFAAGKLRSNSLVGIAVMGSRLQQLALIGLQQVSDDGLVACLAQLPMLQVSHCNSTSAAGASAECTHGVKKQVITLPRRDPASANCKDAAKPNGMQASRRRRSAQDLPAEALERILAQLPTDQERCGAASTPWQIN